MGRCAAFFDLDKTVIAKSSALAFGRPFYQGGLITRSDVLRGAYAQVVYQRVGADDRQIDRMRDYFAQLCKGWRADQVRQIVIETLDQLIQPYIYAEAAALIAEHHAAGCDVVLVSASGEEIVRPIGERLGVTEVIATRMTIADGHYTGEVEFFAAGANKATAVRELAARRGYDLAECYAYSDSVSDAALLSCVGLPTAVNPDRALRKMALENGWPIAVFQHPIPLRRRVFGKKKIMIFAASAITSTVLSGAFLYWYGWRRRKAASTT